MKRLELIEETQEGKLRPLESFTASPSGIPSEAIRRFHRQILEKAITSIDLQTLEERDLSCMVLAVDRNRLPQAKDAIKKFRREFDSEFGAGTPRDSVYCLAIQFFSLQDKPSYPSQSNKGAPR